MTTGRDSALWTRDAVSLAALIAEGAVTAAQVVEAHLERIEQVDSEIGALTTVFAETARAEAAAADRRGPTGPLHGVPVTVKNNLDVAGSPTTWGVAALGQAVATADAPAVSALRRAGAIVIGRTNMPDFATRWHTDNDEAGPTVNPWYPTRSPGGSSGGDAAAVAAGMTPSAWAPTSAVHCGYPPRSAESPRCVPHPAGWRWPRACPGPHPHRQTNCSRRQGRWRAACAI